jgi:para-nitrobenzyl esterase
LGGLEFAAGKGARDAEALRKLPARDLLSDPPSLYRGFGPVLDGELIKEDPLVAIAGGRADRVPLMIGYNSHEVPVSAIGGPDRIAPFLRLTSASRAAWRTLYRSDQGFEKSVVSDALFRGPAIRIAAEHSRNRNPVYFYEFAVLPPKSPLQGAPHASERAYVFGNLSKGPWPTDEVDEALSASMVRAWVAFASGRSQTISDQPWQPFTQTKPNMIRIARGGIDHTSNREFGTPKFDSLLPR